MLHPRPHEHASATSLPSVMGLMVGLLTVLSGCLPPAPGDDDHCQAYPQLCGPPIP
jgi:hypothetical protein